METTIKDNKAAIVTNFMMVAGADGESVRIAGEELAKAYTIERMSFTNVDAEDIDNTGGSYAYDENYRNLRYSLLSIGESKGTSALLCQFTTSEELTEKDLLAIQSVNNNGLVAIINRWHLKTVLDWQNPLELFSDIAGYVSVIDGKVSTNDRRSLHSDFFLEFLRDNGIDAFGDCPQCGEINSMSDLHVNKVCRDCKDGMKNKLLASFGAHLEKSDMAWSKGENLCAGEGCYVSVKGNQGSNCPECGTRFCPDCMGSHVCGENPLKKDNTEV